MKTLLSIGEAARRLGLSVDTIRELERTGKLKAARTPGGHRRFDPAMLDAYQRRQSAPTPKRRQAPAPGPARRRSRARPVREEPPDEPWDEPQPFQRPRPAPPEEKPFHVQLLEELKQASEERAERNRISNLKSYGQSLIPFGATASARSAVIEAFDSYVTAKRFPPSTSSWEAREAIRAKVESVLEPYNEAATRNPQVEAKRVEHERDEEHVQALIERGKSCASIKTLSWDRDDACQARADVAAALETEVQADWSERDVENLVEEVLDEWEEEDE